MTRQEVRSEPAVSIAAESMAVAAPSRGGRRRDHSRDGAILDAALVVLGEVGYAALTMDAVALQAKAGKATVYRRWSSKEELVLDAVARLERHQVARNPLPDTGSVRGDLLALFQPQTAVEVELKDKDAAGLVSLLTQSPGLAHSAHHALVDPWVAAHRALMTRAVERGEVAATVDVGTLSRVLPTLAAYRALVERTPFDWEFLLAVVDGVLMPALRDDYPRAPSG